MEITEQITLVYIHKVSVVHHVRHLCHYKISSNRNTIKKSWNTAADAD